MLFIILFTLLLIVKLAVLPTLAWVWVFAPLILWACVIVLVLAINIFVWLCLGIAAFVAWRDSQ